MTRVVAPSRLHFGLLHVPAGLNAPGQRYGGCGVMIDTPGVAVRVEPASDWTAEGPNATRATEFARRVTTTPHRVVVERCPPEHVGLGVGTALGLAVAKAIRPDLPAVELAPLVGRGQRSGVGLHGFESGGFIVDGGKMAEGQLPELVGRYTIPSAWRIALILPKPTYRWSGQKEEAVFARPRVQEQVEGSADHMHQVLTGELIPALEAGDFARFSTAVHDYNRTAGLPFSEDQGGIYSGRVVTRLIEVIGELGFVGVGQSSWGPLVFAFCPDADRAEYLTDVIWGRFAGLEFAEVVTASVKGATVETGITP